MVFEMNPFEVTKELISRVLLEFLGGYFGKGGKE
jgi:hypothetical protein